jgi:hypothetical protein
VQKKENTVVTGDKPGFDFKAATTVGTLNTQYTKHLKQQGAARPSMNGALQFRYKK